MTGTSGHGDGENAIITVFRGHELGNGAGTPTLPHRYQTVTQIDSDRPTMLGGDDLETLRIR